MGRGGPPYRRICTSLSRTGLPPGKSGCVPPFTHMVAQSCEGLADKIRNVEGKVLHCLIDLIYAAGSLQTGSHHDFSQACGADASPL